MNDNTTENEGAKWKSGVKDAITAADIESLDTLLSGHAQAGCSGDLEGVLAEESWIFTSLCKLGADKIIERLLRIFTLDINMVYNGMTGVQLASQAGQANVVELLLTNGAKLNEDVWGEESEFYLATHNGHDDVIKVLVRTKPDLVTDVEVTYCLFYAACKGGHLSMIHRWMTPGIDVNRPISFVSSLDGCQYLYPLFAACQGSHEKVAEFLIDDLNARFTKDICCSFPEIAYKLVREMFRISDQSREQNFLMSKLGIDHVESSWFEEPDLNVSDNGSRPDSYSNLYETKIDLSKNRLSSLPAEVFWELPSLIHLNLSWNPLKDIPLPNGNIGVISLTKLLLSHCQLEELNVYIFQLSNLEEFDASHNNIEKLYEETESSTCWKCQQLKRLDLSHNRLSSLPSSALQECSSIETVNVSYNQLTSLCSPWQCPLKTLDISHNQFSTFPPSCDQFWADSLQALNSSHNDLTQLHESMVQMNCLKTLDVSHNSISAMPKGTSWSCPLIRLNLSHNKLGVKQSSSQRVQQVLSIQTSYSPEIELPPSCLAPSLNELFLDHNDLHSLPDGLCHLQTLTVLDISHNPNLNCLPLEMGMLWNLLVLKVEGIKLDDKEVQAMIDNLNDPSKGPCQTYDFILAMEQSRRQCMHDDVIKLVVFGCKNSGGQCLVQKLTKSKRCGERNESYRNEHKTLCVYEWKLPYSKKFQTSFKRDLTFQTWEFPVSEEMCVTHPCFLTENSLYLIVHNAFYEEDQLEKISQQIAAIQASVSQPCIIVVCVFHSFNDETYNQLNHNLQHKISSVMKCLYVPFIFDNKPSLDSLLTAIYAKASKMPNVLQGKKELVDRKVPKLFINIVDKMKTIEKQSCSRDELLSVLGLVPKDLQDTVDRRLRLQEYLLEVGAMLHYNVQMGDLWNLVILDPVWLYDLLNSFMQFFHRGRPKVGLEQVQQFAVGKIGLDLFDAFISLLEFFNIGMRIEENSGNESLLIPSLLPENPPTLLSDDISYAHSTSRLYCLPAIPSALWSHVISQLIPAFERFTSSSKSGVPEFVRQKEASFDMKKSFRRGTRKSQLIKGLSVRNKDIQFWGSGIMVRHDQGLIVVEEVQYQPSSGSPIKAILVTVKARGDVYESQDLDSSCKQLAAIGVVTDELEEILELFNPKLMEYMKEYQPIALCPHCHGDIKPGQSVIKKDIDHFEINICAEIILWKDFVYCGKNPIFLNQIVPEFMFLELHEQFRIAFEDLEFMDEKLGQGMVGSVVKGRFKCTDVAIKSFYQPSHKPELDLGEDPMYRNQGVGDSFSITWKDRNDAETKKLLSAFLDLRREVSILSKLKHKCIIAFLGVCVKNQLLLVLELAPFGSFRTCLEKTKEGNNIPNYKPTVSDPTVVTKSVFGKDLTYKILLQTSSGLSYLHSQNIIFRDLKPDNILVMSLNLEADINVKVSDYGISRFTTSRGVSGLVGTVCYMAPEVLAKQTYTNKVDVYSLGIVMFEAVTGVAPVDLLGTNQQPMVSEIAKSSATPKHAKLYKVNCNFPFLEGLMEECWAYRMDERPSINDVIRRMGSDQFLLLHDVLWADPFSQPVHVTCMYPCLSGGRESLWISESVPESSLRLLSVYDITSSMYTVRRKPVQGSKVMAMAKVREKIWLISQGCKETEEIVRSTLNKFEVKRGTPLDEEPSSLVCHTWRPSKALEDHAFVLIGHTNGTITTFHVHAQRHKTVTTTTKLTLHTDFPISNIASVSNNSIIAAAEHTVFLLTIQEQTSGDGLVHPSISFTKSFSFYDALNIIEHLHSLVADNHFVWCSFDGSNKLVKFNWKEQTVEESFVLFFDPNKNTLSVVCSEVNISRSLSINSTKSDDTPPPTPLRRSTLTDAIQITSLCLASNLLALGTDCGGLFLLPISNDNVQDICPFQGPLLRHPEKKKNEEETNNDGMGLHSDSVVSLRSVVLNVDIDQFSVSKIITTEGNKMISLLKADSDECVLRKHLTLQKRQTRRNRTGGVFPGANHDIVFNSGEDGDVFCGSLSRAYNDGKSTFHITNRAEITIWDDVSDTRLGIIKGYRDGFC